MPGTNTVKVKDLSDALSTLDGDVERVLELLHRLNLEIEIVPIKMPPPPPPIYAIGCAPDLVGKRKQVLKARHLLASMLEVSGVIQHIRGVINRLNQRGEFNADGFDIPR